MLPLARNLTGTLIGGIVFGTVWFGHARAADVKCVPYEHGLAQLVEKTVDGHMKIAPIGASEMGAFTDLLQKKGATIKGERAFVVPMSDGTLAVYTKQAKKLCLSALIVTGAKTDAPAPGGAAAPAKPDNKPVTDGREWL